MTHKQVEKPQIVLLFGCSDRVQSQVEISQSWATPLVRPHRVFALETFKLGNWWTQPEYDKFFGQNPERYNQIGDYIWQAVHAQFALGGFEYYEDWQNDVSLVFLGEGYPAGAAGSHAVFTGLFPNARFFEVSRETVLEEIWNGGTPPELPNGTPISRSAMTAYTYGRLRDNGIHTVERLTEMTEAELLEIDKVGPGSIKQIKAYLRGLDLTLKGDDGLDNDPQEAVKNLPIEDLEFGIRTYNCLKRIGVENIGDLLVKSEDFLMNVPNFGKKSIEEVKEVLAERKLKLRDS
jgi:hypothetical protein